MKALIILSILAVTVGVVGCSSDEGPAPSANPPAPNSKLTPQIDGGATSVGGGGGGKTGAAPAGGPDIGGSGKVEKGP